MVRRRWLRPGGVLTVVTLLAVTAACTGGGGASGDRSGGGGDGGDGAAGDLVDRFGSGVVRSADVEYQPDVVVLDGGPESIVSGSADGLQWTIRGDAPGAHDLKVGDVLLATSRVSGRIYGIEPDGDDLLVTLFPVPLEEIVRNGRFEVDTAIDSAAFVFQEIPEHPAAVTEPPSLVNDIDPLTDEPQAEVQPSSFGGEGEVTGALWRYDGDTLVLPEVKLIAQGNAGDGAGTAKLPPPLKGRTAYSTKVDRFDIQAIVAPSVFGITAKTSVPGGVAGTLQIQFKVDEPHVKSTVIVIDGKTTDQSMTLSGLRGVDVSIGLGSEGGLDSNFKVKSELPFDFSAPVVVAGVPMNVNMKFSFLLALAFSAQNSTLQAAGSYALEGAIGYDSAQGSLITPTLSVAQPLLPSIDGVSIGVNGVVFALSVRVQFGPGVPGLTVGPWIKVVVSVGVTNGSSIGLVRCRGATLSGRVAFGGGFSANVGAPEMTAILAKFGIRLPSYDKELASVEFVNKTATIPDVPLCTGPADS